MADKKGNGKRMARGESIGDGEKTSMVQNVRVVARDTRKKKDARRGTLSATSAIAKAISSRLGSEKREELPQVSESERFDDAYLDELGSSHPSNWTAAVDIMGQQFVFKLDTGAEVSAISEELYDQLGKPPLRLPSKVLYGPSQQPLSVLGEFDASLCHMDNSACQTLYVIKGLRTNLMGLPAITALNLIARLDQAEDYMSRIVAQHPALFQGLGKMGEPYHIRLKDDAKPYAVYTARSIPLPMREKFKRS